MYSICKQIHPPTCAEHAVYCNFFSAEEKNLVVAGVNQLTVYRLYPDLLELKAKQAEKGIESFVNLSNVKHKLECLASFSLFGNILSLQSVLLVGAPRDVLLLSFADAKLSLVEYDPATHDLKTLSLHYFEEQDLKDGFTEVYSIPQVRVDPDGRCAAMMIYGNKLVILPFRRDVVLDDIDSLYGGGGGGGTTTSSSPILSSYIIDLRTLDEQITNVVDIQFLHGYYEPTILILYEPMQAWTGRIAVRTDTCAIVAISLNIQEKAHPVIWSLTSLPFDCFMAIAIPKPIGGVLLLAANSILYLNQSVPPYGVSLNSLTNNSTNFPLRIQENVRIALDCAQAVLLTRDQIVLSLKGGELYVLTLVVDGMRSVRSLHFDKAASSVLTTCMCVCDSSFLFLGSRLGNSLLLKYCEKSSTDKTTVESGGGKVGSEPPTKKRKGDEELDLDALEVYGSADAQTGTTITTYVFEVCDSIINIGPCGSMVMAEPPFLSEEFNNLIDPDLELVTTSGYGKNGAISLTQRSVRPQIVTTFELPGCLDMWTVYGPEKGTDDTVTNERTDASDKNADGEGKIDDEANISARVSNEKNRHAFLILSRGDASMILKTGQEITELEHSGFSTQAPTVYAGNIGKDRYILQVSPMGVRLLDGVNQIQHIPIDVGSPIVHCSVADPYVVIMSDDGQLMMLTFKPETAGGGVARLTVSKPQFISKGRVLTFCAYKDVSGMFQTTIQEREMVSYSDALKTTKPTFEKLSFSIDNSNLDDEDEMLYGESDTSVFGSTFNQSEVEEQAYSQPADKLRPNATEDIKPTYWMALCRDGGALEIYSLPDVKLVYFVKHFPIGVKILVDSGPIIETAAKGSVPSGVDVYAYSERHQKQQDDQSIVKEILLVGLGNLCKRPYLMAKVGGDLLIYEAFTYPESQSANHLKIRFKKVQHNLILRDKKSTRLRKQDPYWKGKGMSRVAQLRPFEKIAGQYSGVFIAGTYPYWLFMTSRGVLRTHSMGIDGGVTCFTTFNNINCPRGFMYFNKQGELRISVLPTHLNYDLPWPTRKIPLRCTAHFVAYHQSSKTFAVCQSAQEFSNKMTKPSTEEREVIVVERDERFIYATVDRFSVQLYSPVRWETIPNTKIELDEFEHVTCLEHIMLKSEATVSGSSGYIALGTNMCFGEDVTSRGRVIIFDVIEVVPEPGQPLTKNKMKIIYDKEQKGPVSALAYVNGLLITAQGQKIYVWELKDDDLTAISFIDAYIYIHSVAVVKNLILVGDYMKSISLYRYDQPILSLISRDLKPLEVYTCDFLIDNTTLCFVVSDQQKNLIVYCYHPETRESHGGLRLLRKADFNVGSHINCMFRVRCKLSDPSLEKRNQPLLERRHITYFSTLDGSIGYILPVSEKVYRRLFMLQTTLVGQMPHAAGLNPKEYRSVNNLRPGLSNPNRNILDGELVYKYLALSMSEQSEMAKRIGTTSDQIIDDIIDIDRHTAHF